MASPKKKRKAVSKPLMLAGEGPWKINGKSYSVNPTLSMARWEAYKLLQIQAAYNMDFQKMDGIIQETKEHLNKTDFFNAAVCVNDLELGLAFMQEVQPMDPVIKLCFLFINYKGEDIRTITEDEMRVKWEDFQTAGVPWNFFLTFARNSIPGYTEASERATPNTSRREMVTGNPKSNNE